MSGRQRNRHLELGAQYHCGERYFIPLALLKRLDGDDWISCCRIGERYYLAMELDPSKAGTLFEFGFGSWTHESCRLVRF